jgi:hypothetical protein
MEWIGRILVSVPVVLLLWHAGSEFLAVDTRLDSGGAFDYGSANCRYDVQHLPDTSYAESFCRLIAANAVLFIGVVLALRRARNNG